MSCQHTSSASWLRKNLGLLSAGLILALPLLSACSNKQQTQPPVLPQEQMCPKPLFLPAISPLRLETVTWRVIGQGATAYFMLDAPQYEKLSRNMAEMLRWTKEASFQMDAYRESAHPGDSK